MISSSLTGTLADNYTGLKLPKLTINEREYKWLNKQINMPINAPKTRLKTNVGINQFIKCDII